MVKNRRNVRHQPQLISNSSISSRPVQLDKQAFAKDIDNASQSAFANELILTTTAKKTGGSEKKATGEHATSGASDSGAGIPLSKRKRKQLEQYLEKSKKRGNRAQILDKLSQLQNDAKSFVPSAGSSTETADKKEATTTTATTSISISQAQSKGRKRQRLEQQQQRAVIKFVEKRSPNIDEEEEDGEETSDAAAAGDAEVAASAPTTTSDNVPTLNSDADKPETKVDAETLLHAPIYQISLLNDVDDDGEERNPNAEFDFVKKRREQEQQRASATTASVATETQNPYRQLTVCSVARTAAVNASRAQLPIIGYEQQIMELIMQNDIVVICGETGSGKTTQVPQFLYEAGYASGSGMIAITEPRRVAAVSMSRRVGEELNDTKIVAYQIRYENNVSPATRLKFMTDGVLLRELSSHDFLLEKYSCIILDEAHERSSFTDILIGLLSRIVRLRAKRDKPLKLIIMSATLRVEDFTQNQRLFRIPPPVINVQARQHAVTVHYNKHTPENYLLAAYKKVCKIHNELPPGGTVLVFVTGQRELLLLCRWLRQTFPAANNSNTVNKAHATTKKPVTNAVAAAAATPAAAAVSAVTTSLDQYTAEPIDEDDERFMSFNNNPAAVEADDDSESLQRPVAGDIDEAEADTDAELFLRKNDNSLDADDDDDDDLFDAEVSVRNTDQPMRVLPLYSLLSNERQQLVFEPSPVAGVRTCIIATNVAETSLTLPDVRYVVDCGKIKTRLFDPITGASTFSVMWTSKASAEQRAGRAGRTAPGHCFRLYSSAVFNDEFEQFSPCEIVRRPISDLVLQMKAMHILKVDNFPFPTPPDANVIRAAERELVQLGALAVDGGENSAAAADNVAEIRTKAIENVGHAEGLSIAAIKRRVGKILSKNDDTSDAVTVAANKKISRITPLGKLMVQIPLMPRYSKVLVLAALKAPDLLPYLIVVVCALTVPEVLLADSQQNEYGEDDDEGSKSRQKQFQALKKRWVSYSHQSMLFGDLAVLLKAVGGAQYAGATPDWCAQHGLRHKALREIEYLRWQLSNVVQRVFEKIDNLSGKNLLPPNDSQLERMRQIMLKSMPSHVARRVDESDLASYEAEKGRRNTETKEISVKELRKHAYKCIKTDEFVFIHPTSILSGGSQLPQYILYQELFESKGSAKRQRLYCRHVSAVEAEWLPAAAPAFCHYEHMVRGSQGVDDVEISSSDTALYEAFESGAVFYDAENGKVMCYRRCTWGPLNWPMPRAAIVPYAETDGDASAGLECLRLFSVYFVQGDVFPALKLYVPQLKWPANVMLKSWYKLLLHTQELLKALCTAVGAGVASKAQIEAFWREGVREKDARKRLFLLEEYLMWLPESVQERVRKSWPPVNNNNDRSSKKRIKEQI